MLAVFTVMGFLAGSLLTGRLTGRMALEHAGAAWLGGRCSAAA